jgi:hypothetical protein
MPKSITPKLKKHEFRCSCCDEIHTHDHCGSVDWSYEIEDCTVLVCARCYAVYTLTGCDASTIGQLLRYLKGTF